MLLQYFMFSWDMQYGWGSVSMTWSLVIGSAVWRWLAILGEDVSHLVVSGKELDENVAIDDLLSDKIVVNFDVFGASMVDRVGGKG
jgi:hypothetical protein